MPYYITEPKRDPNFDNRPCIETEDKDVETKHAPRAYHDDAALSTLLWASRPKTLLGGAGDLVSRL